MTKFEGGKVPAGTQLNGMYEIDKHVAMGGMGEVYIGHNIQTAEKVAIKMILPEHANNQIILDLFRKEALTLNRLSHEAIVRYYVFSVDPTLDRPYLAMEFAGGPSLVDRLREGPLNTSELDLLRRRIASGMAAAHRLGVFHRDISPDNVILVNGEVSQAKIIDFGIAKSTSSEGTLIGDGFAGKLNYVSPEQLGLSGSEVTAKSDIYSLGLVLAEAAIGKPLQMGGTQAEVLEKRRGVPDLSAVPAGIRPLIQSMLRPDPADRPADMDEVANWGSAPPKLAKAKKRGFPWLLTGLIAGTLAAAAVFLAIRTDDVRAPDPGNVPTLTAPAQQQLSAAPATIGSQYEWISPPFGYSGDLSHLIISPVGDLPKGLEFENGGDGTGVVAGTPLEAGEASFQIKATSPESLTAVQLVLLVVNRAATIREEPDENLPPRILNHIADPIEVERGNTINLSLGVFDDEEGVSALAMRVEGRLPNGLQFIQAAGGVAQLYGQPSESGDFSFEVVAVDPRGLTSRFPVSLNVAAPVAFREMRDFIFGYDGGPCFLSRPMQLDERMARIEVFAAEVDRVMQFDTDFKLAQGFEADIGLRLITSAQCSLIHTLDLVGPRAMDNRLQFKIVNDKISSGEMLEGLVEGGIGARLFLLDHQGDVTDLAQYVSDSPAGTHFRLPLHADGPQVLVAALADASSGLAPAVGWEEYLAAAQRGTAAVALGFVVVAK